MQSLQLEVDNPPVLRAAAELLRQMVETLAESDSRLGNAKEPTRYLKCQEQQYNRLPSFSQEKSKRAN